LITAAVELTDTATAVAAIAAAAIGELFTFASQRLSLASA